MLGARSGSRSPRAALGVGAVPRLALGALAVPVVLVVLVVLGACGAARPEARPGARVEGPRERARLASPVSSSTPVGARAARAGEVEPAAPSSAPSPALAATPPGVLDAERERVDLPAGASLVHVTVEPGTLASLVVSGPRDALLGVTLVVPPALAHVTRRAPLLEDGLLPRTLSFVVPEGVTRISVLVDAKEPVTLARSASTLPDAPALDLALLERVRLGKAKPPAPRKVSEGQDLVGLPVPSSRAEGYFLEAPARYTFVRADVAALLLEAFRLTSKRFGRDPIGVGDATQWDGHRPASDLGKPRHISHEGGRDVDVALPASDHETSTVRRHCEGVVTDKGIQLCAPGTIRGVDTARLAFFVAVLVDLGWPPVEKVLTDEVYVREIMRELVALRGKRLISQAALDRLTDDSTLRASPWHTDHVHLRFVGPAGRAR